jgi:hypothetical protein
MGALSLVVSMASGVVGGMYIAQNYDVPKVTVLAEKLKTYVVSTAHMLRKQLMNMLID